MGEQISAFLLVRAALAPALCFTVGVWVSTARPAVALTCAAAAMALRFVCERRRWPGGLLALLAAFGLCGAALAGARLRPGAVPFAVANGDGAVLEGQVASAAGAGAVLDVDRMARAPGGPERPARFRAALFGGPSGLLPGERIRVRARLFRSSPAANPGEPDAERRDQAQGITLHAVMRQGEVLRLRPAPAWQRWAQRLRDRFDALAARAIGDPLARALVVTLAVGDRSGLPADVRDDFNASGLAHILSVSGLHIAVVALVLLFSLRWLLLRWTRLAARLDVRRIAGLLAIPALWAYVLLTGAEVPAVRSGIMATGLIAARLFQREPESFTQLAWAAVACLAWDPAQLHSVSFQLSFGAVLGLMTLSRPLRALIPLAPPDPAEHGWRTWPARAREHALQGAVASLAASLATAPVVAATFHRQSLVAVAANVVALPLASLLTAGAALAAACTPIPSVAVPLLRASGHLARGLLGVAAGFGALPFAAVRVAAPSAITVAAFYAGLTALALSRSRPRAWRLGLGAALTLTLLGAWREAAPRLDDALTVTFLSVGQGDSTFIRFPGGATLLIDGGGQVGSHFDPGARILAPFLLDQGISSLDVVVLSHPHPDHALGLIGLAPIIPARQVWIAGDHAPGGLLAELERVERVGEPGGARLRTLFRGDPLPSFGGATLNVLAPARGAHFEKVNDQSLVLKVTYGQVTLLLTGDAEVASETALLAHPSELHATIMKAPHHGSGTSSTPDFVRAAHPRAVVFCVGLHNRFHFPAPQVVARYAACRRYRTDRDGAVSFRTDGEAVQVKAFLGGNTWTPL